MRKSTTTRASSGPSEHARTRDGGTPAQAFARYERLLRRYADSAQGMPRDAVRTMPE